LVLAAPVILLATLLVKLTSRGPVFYTQVRLGRNGRPFSICKIRTMVHDCESQSGIRWATPNDPRITPIGHLLRRTHLDELPQLWNVLKGDMGLVGPRPERPEIIPRLARAIPNYNDRLLVRPGMTGLAQVQLPPDSDLESVRRKLVYDLYYLREETLLLDLKLLACTACYLARIPFSVSKRWLRVPGPEVVEQPRPAAAGTDPEFVLQVQSA
jgi:lipopolysaccharide/colanic/teichoic acid biosynthesis glycosyltransferase